MSRPREPRALTDGELAVECARRPTNEAAWRELWVRFYPDVYGQVHRLLAPFGRSPIHSEIDDITQLVFLRVIGSVAKYDSHKSSLRTFLHRLATNVVIDQLRRMRAVTARVDNVENVAESLPSGEVPADVFRGLLEFLEAAEPRKRRIIDDFIAGFTTEEICQKYAISRSALYTMVYRFRESLRSAMLRK